MLIPRLARIYDVVSPHMAEISNGMFEHGEEIAHAFPHDSIADVGARIGEVAWGAFVDTTGIFVDAYGRPVR